MKETGGGIIWGAGPTRGETDVFKMRMNQRNGIEGTISELKRQGMGRTKYRGLNKVSLANYMIGAACNVKRWHRRATWEMQKEEKKLIKAKIMMNSGKNA